VVVPRVRVHFQSLLSDVFAARQSLAGLRRSGAHPSAMLEAREHLVEALEAYTAALDEHRIPVPYALRDELRMQRATCEASAPRQNR